MKKLLIFSLSLILVNSLYSQLVLHTNDNCNDQSSMNFYLQSLQINQYPQLNYNINPFPNGTVHNNASWDLIFSDEFNGVTSDLLSNWKPQVFNNGNHNGSGNQRPSHLSYIEPLTNPNQNCAEVSNGTLKIWARETSATLQGVVPYLPDSHIIEDGYPNLRTYNYKHGEIRVVLG